ncbi:MAG: glycine cleavage system aminomethyltransferase GcvT [Candidatus Omnitrophota bacterium]
MEKIDNLKQTPLASEHKRLGAKMASFGGWLMPIQYEGIIAEHNWTRTQASVFDICHMGEFIFEDDPLGCGLDKVLPLSFDKMPLNSCRYTLMLNERGGIMDDLIIYKIRQDKFMIVVNAATGDKDFTHIKRHLYKEKNFVNISGETGKLDIQGPKSKDVMKKIVGAQIEKLKYYTFDYFELLGEKCIISRTGYTGELGYEIYISMDKVTELWNIFLADSDIKPAGLGARDTLRIEMGYPLYGQDMDESINPIEAGLENFITSDNGFIGEGALEKAKDDFSRRRIFFTCNSRRTPRHNYKIYSLDNQQIGIVTSGSFSPSLGVGLGIGFAKNSFTKSETKIILKDTNVEIAARIVDRPFYKNGSLKN